MKQTSFPREDPQSLPQLLTSDRILRRLTNRLGPHVSKQARVEPVTAHYDVISEDFLNPEKHALAADLPVNSGSV